LFQNFSLSGGVFSHLLNITYIQERDFGDYICMATNKLGSQSAMITVMSKYTLVMSNSIKSNVLLSHINVQVPNFAHLFS